MSYWRKVAKRAWDETRSEMFASPVKTFQTLAPLIGATVAWFALGGAGIPPPYAAALAFAVLIVVMLLAVVWKLASIPPKLTTETETRHTAELDAMKRDRDDALAELAERKRPPARDPNSIYQFVGKVGHVIGAERRLNQGIVYFRFLKATGEFNVRDEFDYQDLRLIVVRHGNRSSSGGGGEITEQVYHDAVAEVRGPART